MSTLQEVWKEVCVVGVRQDDKQAWSVLLLHVGDTNTCLHLVVCVCVRACVFGWVS